MNRFTKNLLTALIVVLLAAGVVYAATVETADTPGGGATIGGLPVVIPVGYSPGSAGDIVLPTGFKADYVDLVGTTYGCKWYYGLTDGYAFQTLTSGASAGTVTLVTSGGLTVTDGKIAVGASCANTTNMTGIAVRYSR